MGYYLQAIIGKQRTLAQHAAAYTQAHLVSLKQDIAIIPLTDDLYDEIANGGGLDGFYKLSPRVEEWTRRMSTAAPVGYIEAEFFGGNGGQSALMWSNGFRTFGPLHSQDAINQTLRHLGVQVERAHDEFEAVGLGRHRNTDRWIEESAP